MPKPGFNQLTEGIQGLALEAVNAQRIISNDWLERTSNLHKNFDVLRDRSPELASSLWAAVEAPLLSMAKMEISLRCELSASTALSGGIGLRPANLGYEMALGATAGQTSQLKIEITHTFAADRTISNNKQG